MTEKHKVFISYYHKDDQSYRNKFEELFGDIFVNKSVEEGDIDSDNSDEYIKQLIQKGYITDSSVLVILVGPKTYCRKHVDWEISAALNKKVGGYSGVLGLCLPNHPSFEKEYNSDIVPARLVDNLELEYAGFYDWTEDVSKMKARIEKAFKNRLDKSDKIDNSRTQFKEDKCE